MPALLLVLLVALVLGACGQRGPLYFRDAPPPGIKPERGDVYKPVPYPKDAERDAGAQK